MGGFPFARGLQSGYGTGVAGLDRSAVLPVGSSCVRFPVLRPGVFVPTFKTPASFIAVSRARMPQNGRRMMPGIRRPHINSNSCRQDGPDTGGGGYPEPLESKDRRPYRHSIPIGTVVQTC